MDSEVQNSQEFILSDAPLLVEEEQDIDLRNLEHPNAVYPKEIKIKAVALFCALGNAKQVAESLGIPTNVLYSWKNESPWWDDLSIKIRKEQQRDLDALLSTTIHKAVNEISDRLENGDLKYNARTGETVRVPIGAKDLSVTMAILYDKRALLRGEATSIRAENKTSLQLLEEKLKAHALQLKEKDVIATQ